MILIGSQATKFWYSDFPRDVSKSDADYAGELKTNQIAPNKEQKTEFHSSKVFDYLEPFPVISDKDAKILRDHFLKPDVDKNKERVKSSVRHASPDHLYTIKVSHSFWDIHWKKTMFDITFFQNKGCKLDEKFYNLLYKEWEIKHGKKKVNLNVENEMFFTSAVKRKYIHDDVHAVMAYYDEPMFVKLKSDQTKAMLDKNLFDKLSFEDKYKTVREECYVTALERFLIPKDFKMNQQVAYEQAMKLLITSMTKGWFPKFIVENWKNLRIQDINFVAKFQGSKLYERKQS